MRYLKTTLVAAVAWGTAMFGLMTGELVAFAGMDLGDPWSVLVVLVPGSLGFGLFAAAILYLVDRRRLAAGIDIHSGQLRPSDSFVMDLPMDDARTELRDALAVLHRPRIEEPGADELKATTGISWRTLGEVVTIKLQALDGGRTLVQSVSRPRIRATVVDFGANSDNLSIIRAAVERHTQGVMDP